MLTTISNTPKARYFEAKEVQNHYGPQRAREINPESHPQDQYMDDRPYCEAPPIDFTGYQINRNPHAFTQLNPG